MLNTAVMAIDGARNAKAAKELLALTRRLRDITEEISRYAGDSRLMNLCRMGHAFMCHDGAFTQEQVNNAASEWEAWAERRELR